MKTFEVKYKLKGSLLWKTVKDVKGDTVQTFLGASHLLLTKSDESLTLIPIDGTVFYMSPDRYNLILERMNQEAKQTISIEKK